MELPSKISTLTEADLNQIFTEYPSHQKLLEQHPKVTNAHYLKVTKSILVHIFQDNFVDDIITKFEKIGPFSVAEEILPNIPRPNNFPNLSTAFHNQISHNTWYANVPPGTSNRVVQMNNILERVKKQLDFPCITNITVNLVNLAYGVGSMGGWEKIPYFDTKSYSSNGFKYCYYLGPAYKVTFNAQVETKNGPDTRHVTTCVVDVEMLNNVIEKIPNLYRGSGYPHPEQDIVFLVSQYCEREELVGARDGQLTNIFTNPRSLRTWFFTSYLQKLTKAGFKITGFSINDSAKVNKLKELLNARS